MSEDAWERLGIGEDDVKRCDILQNSKTTESARNYWKKCFYLLQNMKYRSYERITRPQRNWIKSIKNDLLKEFKL